jgi:hypothetical protein
VMAVEPGRAVDQQSPDAMRADMTERHRRPSILLGSTFLRRVVAGITVTHVGQSSGKSRPDRDPVQIPGHCKFE